MPISYSENILHISLISGQYHIHCAVSNALAITTALDSDVTSGELMLSKQVV